MTTFAFKFSLTLCILATAAWTIIGNITIATIYSAAAIVIYSRS